MNEPNNDQNSPGRTESAQATCSAFVQRSNLLGREYLSIGGVVLAMEGYICHDFETEGRCWTEATLDEAAARILEAMKPND